MLSNEGKNWSYCSWAQVHCVNGALSDAHNNFRNAKVLDTYTLYLESFIITYVIRIHDSTFDFSPKIVCACAFCDCFRWILVEIWSFDRWFDDFICYRMCSFTLIPYNPIYIMFILCGFTLMLSSEMLLFY